MFAANHLEAHAKANVVFTAMPTRHLPDLGDVGSDPLRQIAPEQMHVGMFCRHFPGLTRAATEIEFREWLPQRSPPPLRARPPLPFAGKTPPSPHGPPPLQHRFPSVRRPGWLSLGPPHTLGCA